jgi:hypothetical protein
VRRVLLAPMHPNGAGDLPQFLRDGNADVFRRLLEGPWELTVRHIGALEDNGLWQVDGVQYVEGGVEGVAYDEIDAADVVVAAEGTFPAVAIARGAPTVIYGQDTPAFYGLPGEQPPLRLREDRYRDYVRYPFDGTQDPLEETVRAAARSEEPILHWRRRFVGEPIDPLELSRLLERIVREPAGPPALEGARERVVLAFADELMEHPELLRRLAPAENLTLAVWAPGVYQRDAEAMGVSARSRASAQARPDRDLIRSARVRSGAVSRQLLLVTTVSYARRRSPSSGAGTWTICGTDGARSSYASHWARTAAAASRGSVGACSSSTVGATERVLRATTHAWPPALPSGTAKPAGSKRATSSARPQWSRSHHSDT